MHGRWWAHRAERRKLLAGSVLFRAETNRVRARERRLWAAGSGSVKAAIMMKNEGS